MPALHALDQACFPPGIAYSRAELRAFLMHPSSFTAVACEGEGILGFAIVRPYRGRHSHPNLHLLTIDVAPTARRQGVGTLLMTWALAQGRRLGSAALTLEVAIDNIPAQDFYKQNGFQEGSVLPGYYNGVLDALSMRLDLP